ncbi:WAT1-related protein [Acorus calamus]|uniref:WAT1-related protein n=1 Tax=Acorus calamus TaxID=4465 RepID=A0AAV9DFL4_ACOCL|nr:WAT1-related protein [Acorus calamus]
MIGVMVVFAGLNVLNKLAIEDGMSPRVLVAYRYLSATAILGPLAFFVERKRRPRLTLMLVFRALLSGCFGLESLAIQTVAGKAKLIGTLIVAGGAMLLALYEGMEIHLTHHQHHHDGHNTASIHPESSSHALGSSLAVAYCISSAIWLIIQAKMITKDKRLCSETALMCLMASMQAVVFALIVERDNWGVWRLGFDVRLLTVAYSGVLTTPLTLIVMSWCIQKKGPLFTSIFNPLTLVIVDILGSIFLKEKLHLGSILGAVLIVIGVYMVLWGEGKENRQREEQLLQVNMPV